MILLLILLLKLEMRKYNITYFIRKNAIVFRHIENLLNIFNIRIYYSLNFQRLYRGLSCINTLRRNKMYKALELTPSAATFV